MRNRAQFSKIVLAAAFGLALALTFSCSSDSGGGFPPNINSGIEISSSSSKLSSSSSVASSSSSAAESSSSSTPSSSSSVVPSSSSAAVSSSSSMPSSSSVVSSSSSAAVSSSSVEYVGGSCNASDYGRVEIGGQVWMAKNWGCYAAGSKCYNNDPAYCETYGRLYDWATAMALPSSCNSNSCTSQISAKHRGICPSGWHIPSDTDWNVLMKFVNPSCSDNSTCDGAGTKLKATSNWYNNGNGTDEFGFAALPGGDGDSDGNFDNAGYNGYWRSASEGSANYAYSRRMYYNREYAGWGHHYKDVLQSVRCLQD